MELGPWRILAPLGAGGMGEVYIAEHSWLPTRRAALKVLQVERLGASRFAGSRFAERFRAEAALLASIDHPNVVRLYDAQITEDGRAWMAMELLTGKALNELLRERGRTGIPSTLQILGDVADGAHAAHLLGIVHRDLKPGNIFITSKHVAKVLDFGTSKLLEHRMTLRSLAPSTAQNVVLGTIPYMSPEQLLNDALDHRSDIYALGIITYQMLSGHHPFVHPDEPCGADELGYRALFTEPTPIDTYVQGCPMELWLLIRSMLARKRDDRPSSMAKVAEKMRALRGEYLAERGLPIGSLGDLLGPAAALGGPQALGPDAPLAATPKANPVPAADDVPKPGAVRAADDAAKPGAVPAADLPPWQAAPLPEHEPTQRSEFPAPPSVPSAPLDAGGGSVPYAAALATDVVSPRCEAELEALHAERVRAERAAARSSEPPRPLELAPTEPSPTRGSVPPAAWPRGDLRGLRSTVRMGPDELAAELAARPRPSATAVTSFALDTSPTTTPLPGEAEPMALRPNASASPLPAVVARASLPDEPHRARAKAPARASDANGRGVLARVGTLIRRRLELELEGMSRRTVKIFGVVMLALVIVAFGGLLRRLFGSPPRASVRPGSSLVSPERARSADVVAAPGAPATGASAPAEASAPTAPNGSGAAASGSGGPTQAGAVEPAKPQPGSSPSGTAAGRGSRPSAPPGGTRPSNSPSSHPSAYPPATPAPTPVPTGLLFP